MVIGYRIMRKIDAAERIVETQFQVLGDREVEQIFLQLPEGHRQAAYALLAAFKEKGGGPVRNVHLVWIIGVLEGRHPSDPLPSFKLPKDRPYRMEEDAGLQEFRRFLVCKVDGDLLAAYEWLRKGAEAGSPYCMVSYGLALIHGEVPGRSPDPTATSWVERATELSGGRLGRLELGELLVKGEFLPREVGRGLALMNRDLEEAGGEAIIATLELAEIYRKGLYGVHSDDEKAAKLAKRIASPWQLFRYRLGRWDVLQWLDQEIEVLRREKERLKNLTPTERQAMNDALTAGLRPRR